MIYDLEFLLDSSGFFCIDMNLRVLFFVGVKLVSPFVWILNYVLQYVLKNFCRHTSELPMMQIAFQYTVVIPPEELPVSGSGLSGSSR